MFRSLREGAEHFSTLTNYETFFLLRSFLGYCLRGSTCVLSSSSIREQNTRLRPHGINERRRRDRFSKSQRRSPQPAAIRWRQRGRAAHDNRITLRRRAARLTRVLQEEPPTQRW